MIHRHAVVIAVLFLAVTDAAAQVSLNMQLAGRLATRGNSQYSNCWGYTTPGGREYAIVGTGLGTQIVDITTDTLKEVLFVDGPPSSWREMKVYQQYAYVVTEGNGAGLQIIDLDSLKLVNTITTTAVPSGHTVSIEGKYLYINGSRYGNGGIVILDLTDPVHPAVVGQYQAHYVHDCIVRNDTIYAAAIYGVGLDIVDVTDKANPKRVNLVKYPYAGTHNADVTADGRYVLTTDEINSDPSQNGNVVRVWDRSDVNDVRLAGSYVAKPYTIAHNIHIKGAFGYVAHYTEGVRVIDLKDPEIPVEVAYYDTYPGSANNTIGNWGVFPYYASDKVIATDMQGGLYVLKFPGQNGGLTAGRAVVTVTDSATGLPVEGVLAVVNGAGQSYTTDAAGKFKFGAPADSVTVTFSKQAYDGGYHERTVTVPLDQNGTGTVTVKLVKKAVGGITVTVKEQGSSSLLQGARVIVKGTPENGFTDQNGTFTVPALVTGPSYRIVVSKFGFTVDSADVAVTPGGNVSLSVSLKKSGRDDFRFDMGWTVGSPLDSGVNGRWARTVPKPVILIGDTLQPPFGRSGAGDACFVTGGTNSLSDNIDGRSTLTSPVFSAADMAKPAVTYWLFTNTRSVPVDDTLFVQVSSDGGSTWTTAQVITGKQGRWKQHHIALADIVTPSATMALRFTARDGGFVTVFDAAVDDVEFGDGLVLHADEEPSPVPAAFALEQNYPNPFNPVTTIRYSLAAPGRVVLTVFNTVGQEVAEVVDGERAAGEHSVPFDASNLAGGVYLYRLSSGGLTQMRKMVLIK